MVGLQRLDAHVRLNVDINNVVYNPMSKTPGWEWLVQILPSFQSRSRF